MSQIASFTHLSKPESRILILGSIPGQKSLTEQQYYAHPRNQFWPIIATLAGLTAQPDNYQDRLRLLASLNIALWDVIASCTRSGSLDSAINKDSIIANDFKSFFTKHPNIRFIAFNGQTAAKLFKQYRCEIPKGVKTVTLPSTSPAYATMSTENKTSSWLTALSPWIH